MVLAYGKPLWGALSIALGIIAYGVYIWQTAKKGGVRPHPFSWFLWTLTTFVAYLIQRKHAGGPGSWVTILTSVVCFIIFTLTFFKFRWRFSGLDATFLLGGILVLGFYWVWRDPTQVAIIATAADVMGYGPTIKKGWIDPHEDNATAFFLNGLKYLVALAALSSYSVATLLYPFTIGAINVSFAGILLVRRWQIK